MFFLRALTINSSDIPHKESYEGKMADDRYQAYTNQKYHEDLAIDEVVLLREESNEQPAPPKATSHQAEHEVEEGLHEGFS